MEILPEFIHIFETLEDPRIENHNFRHKMIDILVISFLAAVCGANDWDEVKEFGESGLIHWFLMNFVRSGLHN